MKDYITQLENKKKKQKIGFIIVIFLIVAAALLVIWKSGILSEDVLKTKIGHDLIAKDSVLVVKDSVLEQKDVALHVYDSLMSKVAFNNEIIYYLYDRLLIMDRKKHLRGTGERIKETLTLSERKLIDSVLINEFGKFRHEINAYLEEKRLGGKIRIRVISQGQFETERKKIFNLAKTLTSSSLVTDGQQNAQFKNQVKYFNDSDEKMAIQISKSCDSILENKESFRIQRLKMTVAKGSFEIWIGDSIAIE